MRLPIICALLFAAGTPASAAPNVFWTFGFDFPISAHRAPRFGEIRTDLRLAASGIKTERDGIQAVYVAPLGTHGDAAPATESTPGYDLASFVGGAKEAPAGSLAGHDAVMLAAY